MSARGRAWLVAVLAALALCVFAPGEARAQSGGIDDLTPDDSAAAKELALPEGPTDEVIFLYAKTDKQKVVVGEQVTLSVYLYYRVAYEMSERRDPKLGDALRYPLLTDPSATTPVFTTVKGERYGARLVERLALIPLHAGDLVTGGMPARFTGRQIGSRVQKISNDVVVKVEEPPAEGRPPGYVLGTVGQLTLTASVSPKSTVAGGSVSVVAKVQGFGNLPARLPMPTVAGGKWLEPTRKETLSVDPKRLTVGGSRTLEYLLRLEKPGDIALGTLSLPVYDPITKKYVTLTAELGTVKVDARAGLPQAAPDTGEDKQRMPLFNLPKARPKPTAWAPKREVVIAMPLFALGLFAPPALALLVIGGVKARERIKARRAASGAELRGKLKDAMKDAAKADKAHDPRTACAAIERAVHAALEAKTGLKTRGFRMEELEPSVAEAGLDKSLAAEAKAILSECESLRFMPQVDEASFTGLRDRAKAFTKKLEA